MKGIIRLGDKTSSGGTVTSASTSRKANGKGIARMGDSASCPKHGATTIAQGSEQIKDEGKAVAFHGHKLSCGCTLITSLPNVRSA